MLACGHHAASDVFYRGAKGGQPEGIQLWRSRCKGAPTQPACVRTKSSGHVMPHQAASLLMCATAAVAAWAPGWVQPRTIGVARPCVMSLVGPDVLSRLKSELYRVEDATDGSAIVREQSEVIWKLVGELEDGVMAASASNATALDALLAPHLPLLMGRSFPLAAREVLMERISTEGERAALLKLSEYVVTAQTEVADALGQLEWRQAQKLRELCEAAMDGGTERVVEMAQAMKEELDTDFCNYINYAIEQEENKIAGAGAKPFVPPPAIYGTPAPAELIEEERRDQAIAAAEAQGMLPAGEDGEGPAGRANAWRRLVDGVERPSANPNGRQLPSAPPSEAADGALEAAGGALAAGRQQWRSVLDEASGLDEPVGEDAAGEGGDGSLSVSGAEEGGEEGGDGAASVEQQQWLLVLRLVRRGVYSMLAKDYEDDVKHIRYIIGLASASAREDLTMSTMLAMSEEQQDHFSNTIARITANLSVQRNAQDTEIYNKVCEVREAVRRYQSSGYGGGQGEFSTM